MASSDNPYLQLYEPFPGLTICAVQSTIATEQEIQSQLLQSTFVGKVPDFTVLEDLETYPHEWKRIVLKVRLQTMCYVQIQDIVVFHGFPGDNPVGHVVLLSSTQGWVYLGSVGEQTECLCSLEDTRMFYFIVDYYKWSTNDACDYPDTSVFCEGKSQWD